MEASELGNDAEMPFWQKAGFIVLPLIWALLLLPIVLISGLVLILLPFSHTPRPSTLELIAALAVFAISGTGLWLSFNILFKAVQRKIRTGSFFPHGNDLIDVRRHVEKRTFWRKIAIAGFFCLVAVGATQSLLNNPHHRQLSMWIVPALMWVAAILMVLTSFLRPEPKWLAPALAGTWCLAGIWYAVSVLATRTQGLKYWGFPILMFVMAAIAVVEAIRGNGPARTFADKGKELSK